MGVRFVGYLGVIRNVRVVLGGRFKKIKEFRVWQDQGELGLGRGGRITFCRTWR